LLYITYKWGMIRV